MPSIASSAVVVGTARMGEGALLAEGAVIRSQGIGVEVAGYSPCIPPGDDVDCAGGSGNDPRYVPGPVSVDPAYGDPYGLDAHGDGVGCES